MAYRFCMALAASMLVAGAAQAQTAVGSGGLSDPSLGDDTSRTVNNDRNQQFALDNIRDEVDSAKRAPKDPIPSTRASRRRANQIVAATPADFMVGAVVNDSTGVPLGTIEAIKPEGVQLLSGSSRAMVPADVFGKKGEQLLLNVTKAEFDKQTGGAQ
ncbi:hypothetical protein [Sphingomonas sp.]|uniref:hypothetical protein n=1 Tax=Sphingomonas sp. TaxID=28214 RepID=UPI002C8E8592|nr:hypothetical protein [Sphingomonas sp.]HTG39203.1 hypothetical protein [Sphingomonas sp.]